ncbi:tRNA lysidine(34) synthetase TilS [Hoyosella sp. G463]|uniref:tRNA(Ile)-lysidine synthase n=1 Tax=Lolliginicoccus lacisalsi TaxID=2742202 RepID=A0A927JDK8_9ACTN|nr:tRNA lysidine(34) synthetase TilS [Lolliginicoccus lacisalsi]MBD8507284.1 tRNA lysidine(34) synthetase TilS [Lolliginicoccus lacisalsi]
MDNPRPRVTTPALHSVRLAVRSWMARHHDGGPIAVAVSGGADSMALCAAVVAESPGPVAAITIDHQLQDGSRGFAEAAARAASALGCGSATIATVTVTGPGGMEAAARRARYAALDDARAGATVLLGHTLDDQAETVLLGLARGSGARSISGMRALSPPWGRPLLGIRRTTTEAACAELGLEPFQDPQNADERFTRVRLRQEALPLLESILGGGAAEALARTARLLQDDNDALDGMAAEARMGAQHGTVLLVEHLQRLPVAVRSRVVRSWLQDEGAGALASAHLGAIDELVTRWRGQGAVAVPWPAGAARQGARLVVERRHGTLALSIHERVLAHAACSAGHRREERGT